MLYRFAMQEFLNWKKSKGTALLVTGARQIGKTFLVREFAKANYERFVEINFVDQEDAKQIFAGNLDANTIIQGITSLTKQQLIPGKTLIFFDEIQECPNARTAIKFLVEDGRFAYIESGSLLGVQYQTVKSLPVGFEHVAQMFPLSFEEFSLACGLQPDTISLLKDCYQNLKPVLPAIHEEMKKLWRAYLIVGGMPAVVQKYIETHDLAAVLEVQQNILQLYRQDIIKYSATDKHKITAIFEALPAQLNAKNRRFKLNAIKATARMERYAESFIWLADAGLALPWFNVTAPEIRLKLHEQRNLFKLYLNDVGLLCAASLENVQFAIFKGDLSINWGSILENVFAQEFHAHDYEIRFLDKKIGEIDFLLQDGQQVVPVEIKSGADYKKHTSLTKLMAAKNKMMAQGIVFCGGNVEVDGNIIYLPWYLVMFLQKKKIPSGLIFKVDLSNLNQLKKKVKVPPKISKNKNKSKRSKRSK
ncbi:MAG: ATP-binding protein [Bacteriovoracaceae bacterium]|nr:ATP-binding protein [Bacteriovoracaceae bacterium]